jgi:hypothetical protein
MKKLILCISFMTMISTAFAQLYVRANVGYNLPMGAQLIGTEEHYVEVPNEGYFTTYKGVYGSLGAGISFRAAVGGNLKNGILGYDVEVGYLIGKKYDVNSHSDNSINQSHDDHTYKSSAIQIAPSLTFTTGAGKFQPFARIGPMVSFATLKEEQHYSNTYYDENITYSTKYSGGISVGFKGVVGVTYGISESLLLFAELDFISLSHSPKKRKITGFTYNGQDRLNTIDPEDIEIEFEKEETLESEEGEPTIRPTYAMGSVGLQVGVKFVIVK